MYGPYSYGAPQPMGYQPAGYQPMGYAATPMMMQPAVPMMAPVAVQPMVAPVMAMPTAAVHTVGQHQMTAQWMPMPEINFKCPSGLEYLTAVDELFIQEKVSELEVFTGIEVANQYAVRNRHGQLVYYVGEQSDGCQRLMCRGKRSFEMKIYDAFNREILRVYRPYKFCMQEVEIYLPSGDTLGYVHQEFGFTPRFRISDSMHQPLLYIEGPMCRCPFSQIDFKIISRDGTQEVGSMSRLYSGFLQETFSKSDNFLLRFPMDLDVTTKAILFGSTFLIDFTYFEKQTDMERFSTLNQMTR